MAVASLSTHTKVVPLSETAERKDINSASTESQENDKEDEKPTQGNKGKCFHCKSRVKLIVEYHYLYYLIVDAGAIGETNHQ
jgi:hypothetical protein